MGIRKPTKTIFDVEAAEQNPTDDKRAKPKVFVTERQENGLYTIKFTAGGEVPALLKGNYTSSARAEQAVQSFLLSKHA